MEIISNFVAFSENLNLIEGLGKNSQNKPEILVNMYLFIHSFWLDAHAVPARVALGVTTLLTMSTQTASINSALPPVAYTKAIDVWQV